MSAMSGLLSEAEDKFPIIQKSGDVITFTFRMDKKKFRKMATDIIQEMDEEDNTLTEKGESLSHSPSNSQANVDLESSRMVEALEASKNLCLSVAEATVPTDNSQYVHTTFQEESSFADCARSSNFLGETSDHVLVAPNEETSCVQTKNDSESENWPEISPFTETETVATTEIKSEVCNGILRKYMRLELSECIVIKISIQNGAFSVDAVKYKEASKSRENKKVLGNSYLQTSGEVNEVKDPELEQKSFLDINVEESSGFSNTEKEMQPETLNERSMNSGRDLTDIDDINKEFQVDSNEMAGKSDSPPPFNSLNESQRKADEYLKAANTLIENIRTEAEEKIGALNLMAAEIIASCGGASLPGSAGTEKQSDSIILEECKPCFETYTTESTPQICVDESTSAVLRKSRQGSNTENEESAAKSIIETETVLFGNKSSKAPNITGDTSPKSLLNENFDKAENTLEKMHHAGNAGAICSSDITNYDKDKFSECSYSGKSPVKDQMPKLCIIKEKLAHSDQRTSTQDLILDVIEAAENFVKEEIYYTAELSEEIQRILLENHASKNEENNSTVMIQTENPRDIATDGEETNNFAPKKNQEIGENRMAMESPDDQASENFEKKRAALESTSRPEEMADTALEDSPDEAGSARKDRASIPDEAGSARKDRASIPDEAGSARKDRASSLDEEAGAPLEESSSPKEGAAPQESASSPNEEAGAALEEDSSSQDEEADDAPEEDSSSPDEEADSEPEDSSSPDEEADGAPEENSSNPDEEADGAPEENSSSPDEEADGAPEKNSSSPDEEADGAPEKSASSPGKEAGAAPEESASSPDKEPGPAPEDSTSADEADSSPKDPASSADEAGAAQEEAVFRVVDEAGAAQEEAAFRVVDEAGAAPEDTAFRVVDEARAASEDTAFRVVDEADISPEDTASRPDEEIDPASGTAFEDEETEIPEGGKGTNEDAAAEHAAFQVSTPEVPHTREGELYQKNGSSANVLLEDYEMNEKGIGPEDTSSENNEKDNSQKNCLKKGGNRPSEDSSPKDEDSACLEDVNQKIEPLPKEVMPEDGKGVSSENAKLETTVEEVDAAPTRANRNLISPFKESVPSSFTENGKRIKTRVSKLLNTGSASKAEKATRPSMGKSLESYPSQSTKLSYQETRQKRMSIDSASSEPSNPDRSRRSRTPELRNPIKIVARSSPRRPKVTPIQEETESNTPNTRTAKSSKARPPDAQAVVSSVSTRRTKRAT